MAIIQAAESEPQRGTTSDLQGPAWGKLIAYSDRKGAPKFEWTDTGRHGVALLRRCALLQHVSKACSDEGSHAAAKPSGPASPSSGAARCLSLLQGGGPGGGCLAAAAQAFLGAACGELRHQVLRELHDLAAVMERLDWAEDASRAACRDQETPTAAAAAAADATPAAAAPATAAAAAVLHVWRRSGVWVALHRAPADLLGGLNEAFVESFALGPLAALRGATCLLMDSWRAGLAQLGGLLLRSATECGGGAAGAAPAPPRSPGGGSGAQRPPEGGGCGAQGDGARGSALWLLSWRLYLAVHTRMEAVFPVHQLQPNGASSREVYGMRGAAPHKGQGAADRSATAPGRRAGAAAAPHGSGRKSSAAGDGLSEHAGTSPTGPAVAWEVAATAPQAVVLKPRALLASFVSACAGRAACAATSAAETAASNSRGRLFLGPSGCDGSSDAAAAESSYAGVERALRTECVQVAAQLREALAEDWSEAELERRVQQLLSSQGDQAATVSSSSGNAPTRTSDPGSGSGSGGAATQPSASSPLDAVAPGSSSQARNDDSAAVLALTSEAAATARTAAASVAAGAGVGAGGACAGSTGDDGGGGKGGVGPSVCADSACAVPGALLAELPPRRVSRLSGSPGLLSLQLQLALPHRASAGEVAGGATERLAAGREDDAAERHARRAALVYGICSYLHHTHDRLAGVHVTSGICAPPSATGGTPPSPQDGAALRGRQSPLHAPATPAPFTAILQLPAEPLCARVEDAAIAAGAAALAAAGAAQGQPPEGTAAVRAAAAAKAAAWVAARSAGRATVITSCAARGEEDDTEDAEAGVFGSPAWARGVERHVAALLAPEHGRERSSVTSRRDAVTSLAATTRGRAAEGAGPAHAAAAAGNGSGSGGGPDFSSGPSPTAVLMEALLMYAGRVALLGVSLGAPSAHPARGLPQYRWGAGTGADASRVAAATAAGDTAAAADERGTEGGATCCGVAARLASSPTRRALLLHWAVSAATAAANRLTHVAALHAPGSGSGSDLRPLCAAHSDAGALGSAAQALLGLACAAGAAQLGGPQAMTLALVRDGEGGEARGQQQEQEETSLARRSMAAAVARARTAGQGDSGGSGDGFECLREAMPRRQSAPAVDDTRDRGSRGGPRLTVVVKFNWRRSLRRIMPYRSERSASHGRDRAAPAAAAAGGTACGSANPPRPAVSRACWAGDPVDPAPLPPPAPLCSISTAHLEAAAAAARAPPVVAAGPAPWRRPFEYVFRGSNPWGGAAASRLSDSSLSGSSSGGSGLFAVPAEEWVTAGSSGDGMDASVGAAGAGTGGGLLVLGAAEAGLLLSLHTVCRQLRGAAARVGELLEAEMGQRAAAICRSSNGAGATGNGSAPAGGAGADRGAAAAARQVALSLLRPLREALCGLHPVSQAELLSRGFAAALRALRQQCLGGTGGGGAGVSPQASGRRGAGVVRGGTGEQLAVGRFGEGLILIEEELAAGWRQVEAAAAAVGQAGGGGDGAGTFRWEAGGYDFAYVRRELAAQVQSLRGG